MSEYVEVLFELHSVNMLRYNTNHFLTLTPAGVESDLNASTNGTSFGHVQVSMRQAPSTILAQTWRVLLHATAELVVFPDFFPFSTSDFLIK